MGRLYIVGVDERLGGSRAADFIRDTVVEFVNFRTIGDPCPIWGDNGILDQSTKAMRRRELEAACALRDVFQCVHIHVCMGIYTATTERGDLPWPRDFIYSDS
jgi:hypothetical protein